MLKNDDYEEMSIFAESRDILLEFIRGVLKNVGEKKGVETLKIECSCGKEYVYKNLKDIPYDSLKCKCGSWVICYGDCDTI